MKRLAALLAAALLAVPASAKIRTKVVEYKDGDTVLQGYAAWEDGFTDARPGVLVVHEWWGHGPYARKRAEMLAKQGYTAFALDMYGKGVYAKDHEEAGKLAGAFFGDRIAMRKRALAGLEQLKKLPFVDARKLAAIGYCFGGTTVLELARAGTDLKGVASFHGNLATPTPATGTPKAKVIVFQGGADKMTLPAVPGFIEEMDKVKADWQLVQYGGAVHSFTVPEAGDDPSKGMAYDKNADARSWKALLEFLTEVFK
ncbi:MAG: dienelactone hydrolase family protein [Elusimicrobia bacterium]|nr:dienelactone hydrolase family protein [Elusimicrobiota bacterium]